MISVAAISITDVSSGTSSAGNGTVGQLAVRGELPKFDAGPLAAAKPPDFLLHTVEPFMRRVRSGGKLVRYGFDGRQSLRAPGQR